MIQLRKAERRGHANHGWLETHHTFSFASYHDPQQMGFRTLRVMNEDRIAAGQGFGTHPHRNMEIITYVLSGALEHMDSMGNGEVIHPGELQRMSAGTGITHSEFNHSDTEPVHLYQIWLLSDQQDLEPTYEQRRFAATERHNQFQLVASPNGDDESLRIHQDARIYLANLDAGCSITHSMPAKRFAWLQVLKGAIALDELSLAESDGAAISECDLLAVDAYDDSEIMLFDLN